MTKSEGSKVEVRLDSSSFRVMPHPGGHDGHGGPGMGGAAGRPARVSRH